MIVITVTNERDGLDRLMSMFNVILDEWGRDTITNIRVGIDPMDEGVKLSVNGHVWSPPCYGVISADSYPVRVGIVDPERAEVTFYRGQMMPPCGCKGDTCFQDANPDLPPQRECRRGLPDE